MLITDTFTVGENRNLYIIFKLYKVLYNIKLRKLYIIIYYKIK